jgi:hypothetical protein
MAEEIIYNIKVDSKDAEKSIDNLNSKVSGVEAAGKKGSKGLSSLKKGVKGIGVALKAAGIGVLVTILGALFEVMRKNQKVLDAISTATNFISVAFNAVTDALSKAYDSVTESTGGFDALGKVMSGLLTLAITPLKLAFYELKLAMQTLKVGYEKLFGDATSVEQAKADLAETTEAIKQVAKDAVDAGKDIYNNISEAVDEVGEGASAVVAEISKIDPKKLLETSSNMTKLGNAAAIAAAKQSQLVEEYDRQAEAQRQIRDDESLSIEERKKANEELGRILKKQEEAMLKEADLQLANAKAQYEVNKNQENYIALIDAETNRKGVLAQITGFISEQKVNQIALLKEEREITNSLGESESRIAIEKQKANANLIQNAQDRITRLLEINASESEIEANRLQAIIDNENAGTQAKANAQIALNEFLAANGADRVKLQSDLKDQEVADEKTAADAKAAIRKANLNNIAAGIGVLKSLAGKSKVLQAAALIGENAVGIAKQVAATQVANQAAKATPQAIATSGAAAVPVITANNLSLKLGIATSIAATAKGLAALGKGGSPAAAGAGVGAGPSAGPQAPSFNVVGQSPNSVGNAQEVSNNQIENSNNNPTRAYVVSTDISNQQQLDRDIETDNSLG